jgi:uncharacterized UPF0160 family protein
MKCLKNFMTIQNKKLKLITHDDSFHADDVFACAALGLMLEKKKDSFEVIRTRDKKIIKNAKKDNSYVFDIGGIYDAEQNKFDHHQPGGAGKRENGIEYASLGLVWKKFGPEICGSKKAAEILDKKLIAPIDAFDNGMNLVKNLSDVSPYFIEHFLFSMRPTWKEKLTNDEMFFKSVEIAKIILTREIIQAQDALLAENAVISIYKSSPDKRIVVLDKSYPYEYILDDFPEPIFVIYPKENKSSWRVKAVKKDPKTFVNRKDFPKAWAGLRDQELQKVSGVSDAIFCHRGLFLAVAKSKEGAVKLAELALLV